MKEELELLIKRLNYKIRVHQKQLNLLKEKYELAKIQINSDEPRIRTAAIGYINNYNQTTKELATIEKLLKTTERKYNKINK